MHHPTNLCALALAILSAIPGTQAGLYTKKSPVLQVEAKDYERLVGRSNYTSVVEFYAPWCGHCQNLKPAYEKAAKNLDGLAKVAAVDCDDDANKPFCGTMGVQGFPTLKIVRPRKGGGKPTVEDYNGPRTATGIVDAVVERINNHVKKITDKDVDAFLAKSESPKAILFTEKGATTALLKSIAIEFLDVISVAQVRDRETKTVEKFGVEKFPTLVLVPGGDKEPIVYDGELKKPAIVEFLSQAGQPNPDPAPLSSKSKKNKASKSKTAGSEESSASSSESKSTASTAGDATQAAPVIVESAAPIPTINTPEKLIKECLTEKSSTCVLAFVPSEHDEKSKEALTSLSELAFKYAQGKHKLFPIFEVSKENEAAASLIKSLELSGEVELVAINARRGWWRRFDDSDFGAESVASWIDKIRLSEGAKNKLPEGVAVASAEVPQDTADASSAGTSSESSTQATDPTPEPETATESVKHEEL